MREEEVESEYEREGVVVSICVDVSVRMEVYEMISNESGREMQELWCN